MVKSDTKLARLQVCRIHRGRCGIDFEVFRFVFCNQIVKSLAKIWQKSVILPLDGISENVILLQEVAIVNVECSKFVLAHGVDLLDVDKFAIASNRHIIIWGRGD